MQAKFAEHISSSFHNFKHKKLLIAISGGLDSVVLTHLVHQLGYSFILAHCNFKLRGEESDLDESFVKSLSEKYHCDVFTKSFETEAYAKENKLSTQIAARQLRYDWFNELVNQEHLDFILTAHHADDNLETFLINFTRGTGLQGLTGIPEKNGNIIRPLLPFTREEIFEYAQSNHLTWREDTSNNATKYQRNKLRHQVIPILKELNPSLLASFGNTLSHLKASNTIIKDKVEEVKARIVHQNDREESLKIDLKALHQLKNPHNYLFEILKPYNFSEWQNVYELCDAQSGKQVFSERYRLVKDRDFLILTEKVEELEQRIYRIDKPISKSKEPIPLKFENVNHKKADSKNGIYIDKDLLNYPLSVRKWKKGDYFYPNGMTGKKKLSKFFKDNKFSLIDKENTWLLCNGNGAIIWIINHRQDRRFIGHQNLKITTE